jgi:uncharacterized surface protein with fasciclin (FAS1) repeats
MPMSPGSRDKQPSTCATATGRGGGKAMLKTVQGEDLTFARGAGRLWVIDAKGDKAEVTIPNVMQSNGVIQVINKVLLPS